MVPQWGNHDNLMLTRIEMQDTYNSLRDWMRLSEPYELLEL